MKTRTKASILKALEKECAKLRATRNSLGDLMDELEAQATASEEAVELLEACIEKLSELN